MDGKTQAAAAASAGMSIRTAREWDSGPVPSGTKHPRDWRTRADPFSTVWSTEIEPLLQRDRKGVLEAKWVLAELCLRHPAQFHAGQARTLQRRFREWRALHGPEPEVYFEQVAVPGREAAIDFTHGADLGVTIAGEPLPHLLFEFVLSYSGWRWVAVAFGETFEALVAGLQGALWALGGMPAVLRSENLSAATHELKHSSGRDLTTRFRAVLEHYGMRSSRITPGRAHENGVAEQAHRRVHADLVEVRYRGQLVQTMPRLRGEDEYRIDYRHVIGWLVRKPGAFTRYRYREDLFPSARSDEPSMCYRRRTASAPTSSICGSCTWPPPPAKRGWSRSSWRCSIRSAASTTSRSKRRSHHRR